MIRRSLYLIDGENLVFRFQDMLEKGRKPMSAVTHEKDVFVWSKKAIDNPVIQIQRAVLYTSAVGSDTRLQELTRMIQSQSYNFRDAQYKATGRLIARVFKKLKAGHKTRLVDIHITLDALVAAYTHDVDFIHIMTGDSDFIPVIEQIMRQGKVVHVSAFSSGLSPDLERVPDAFKLLDEDFFVKEEAIRV